MISELSHSLSLSTCKGEKSRLFRGGEGGEGAGGAILFTLFSICKDEKTKTSFMMEGDDSPFSLYLKTRNQRHCFYRRVPSTKIKREESFR